MDKAIIVCILILALIRISYLENVNGKSQLLVYAAVSLFGYFKNWPAGK
jgi:hypothetical protein